MEDTTTTSSSTPETVWLDTPEELSEADRLELAALSGVGGSPTLQNGAVAPSKDLSVEVLPPPTVEGYKPKSPTPNATFAESLVRESFLSNQDDAAAKEAAVVKPNMNNGFFGGLPQVSQAAAFVASVPEDTASIAVFTASEMLIESKNFLSRLQAEQAALPARLDDADEPGEIRAIRLRALELPEEISDAAIDVAESQVRYYALLISDAEAQAALVGPLLEIKRADMMRAEREFNQIANQFQDASQNRSTLLTALRSVRNEIASLNAARKKRILTQARTAPLR